MKENIISILKESNFTKEFIKYIEDNFPTDYKAHTYKPYDNDYENNPLLKMKPEKRLFESLAQLIPLKETYEKKGIPLIYLYNSIDDFNYRIQRYYASYNEYGISSWDIKWLTSFYRAKIFDIVSLRFEISYFSYNEIERSGYQYMYLDDKWKKRFPEGIPIITIHILKDTDLSPKKVDKSFNMASEFFEKYFSEHLYGMFVCRTWMLYEPMHEILSDNSNIKHFAKRFKIIAENKNSKQALDRIYGTSNMDYIKEMNKNTSLEKLAYRNIDKLGVAAGIIYK